MDAAPALAGNAHVLAGDEVVFRIFDLPRELRDNIYDLSLDGNTKLKLTTKRDASRSEVRDPHQDSTADQALVDELLQRAEQQRPGLIASVKYPPHTATLLCSKVMKQEYEERVKLAMTLVLRDNENYSFQLVNIPEQVQGISWLEFHLILFCHHCPAINHSDERHCQAAREVSHHRRWIEDLLTSQLIQLRSFNIHVYLCCDGYKLDSKEKVPCQSIVEKKILQDLSGLSKLKQLTLYKYEWTQAKSDLEGPKVKIFEWPFKEKRDTVQASQEPVRAEQKLESSASAPELRKLVSNGEN